MMFTTYGKTVFITVYVGCLLFGCSAENESDELLIREYSVDSARVIVSSQDTPYIGIPTAVKAITEGVIIADVGFYQITKMDNEGNRILSFGNRGQGPGEFQSIAGIWPFDNGYLVYDYNSFKFLTFDQKGKLVDEEVFSENPVIPGSEFAIPITLDVISPDKFLIPTGGRQGSLFAIANRINGQITYAGAAIGEFIGQYNNRDVWESYSRGEIPEIMLNLVMLSSCSEAIYALQQTTGVLEKYTHAGELVWEKELNIPAQKDLFDQIKRKNMEIGLKNEPRYLFIYARAMVARNDGVALLLNMPDGHSVTIAWVPDDGSRIDLISIEGLAMSAHGFMEGFTVSNDYQFGWYVDRGNGTIYQFDWPL